jgi:glycine cleavage system H protein
LESAPDKVNVDPYGAGWLVELSVDDARTLADALATMLDATGYLTVIGG